jgi:hypothetical protein
MVNRDPLNLCSLSPHHKLYLTTGTSSCQRQPIPPHERFVQLTEHNPGDIPPHERFVQLTEHNPGEAAFLNKTLNQLEN